ncbi:15893_t:CDS:2, partial [Entrophospora sp. SA101]
MHLTLLLGEQPVAYESRKLSPAELNYPVHEKELLAIVHAIKLWRPYLEGQRFTVITDHASLEYIKSQTNLSRRQARWLEVLQATDFDVKYRPGKTNIVADALSRQIHLTNMTIISSKLADVLFLQQEYQKDNYFSPIWNVLNDKETKDPKQQTRVKYFELKDDVNKGDSVGSGKFNASCKYCTSKWTRGEVAKLEEHLANHCSKAPATIVRKYLSIVLERKDKAPIKKKKVENSQQTIITNYHDSIELPNSRIT